MDPNNIRNPVLRVMHTTLTRSGESPYRSRCPVCDGGILLVYRDDGGKLRRRDRCVRCGQAVLYLDAAINGEAFGEEPPVPSFMCPKCGAVSHNPNDTREGYCGRCHAWTGESKA